MSLERRLNWSAIKSLEIVVVIRLSYGICWYMMGREVVVGCGSGMWIVRGSLQVRGRILGKEGGGGLFSGGMEVGVGTEHWGRVWERFTEVGMGTVHGRGELGKE